ncbi:MAG: redox-regulated ATPase YchF, partial [Clostridiales bacterium]
MALSCGIVGLPMTGKTTLFNLLTGQEMEISNFYSGKTHANEGIAFIPDERVDFLADMYHPKKKTYAQLEVIDIPGLVQGASKGEGTGNSFLASIGEADVLMHVIRSFENDDIIHVDDSINIKRDIDTIDTELLLADLDTCETRLERIKAQSRKKIENPLEEEVLEKILAVLEEESPMSSLELSEDEKEAVVHLSFLTNKPMVLVVNLDEKQFKSGEYPNKDFLAQYAKDTKRELLEICAQAEGEIAQLDEEDRLMFLEDLNISEPGMIRLAQTVYKSLGLISFITAGEDEVRAWTIRQGLSAKKAAGKIHSD